MTTTRGIRDKATFERLRRDGRRVRVGPLTVTWVADPPGHPARFAYAIGRKFGGAVERNRLRRRLRAVVGTLAPPPGAYLIGASAAAKDLNYEELRGLCEEALSKLGSRGAG